MAEKDTLYNSLRDGYFLIAGPCVIEKIELLEEVANFLVQIRDSYNIPVIFKASFDKANRTSATSFRGPGMEEGLEILAHIKNFSGLPILTDIHESWQAEQVGDVVDIIQIPAFLCRQTDLLLAAGETGKIVNIKKAQFLSGKDMVYPVQKVEQTGNSQIMLTERGTMFGYNNLVVDFRNVIDMAEFGYPVIMDATHSVQLPGGAGGKSGGLRQYVPYLAKAAKAVGVKGFFFEIHPDPDNALSDGPNMLNFEGFSMLADEIFK